MCKPAGENSFPSSGFARRYDDGVFRGPPSDDARHMKQRCRGRAGGPGVCRQWSRGIAQDGNGPTCDRRSVPVGLQEQSQKPPEGCARRRVAETVRANQRHNSNAFFDGKIQGTFHLRFSRIQSYRTASYCAPGVEMPRSSSIEITRRLPCWLRFVVIKTCTEISRPCEIFASLLVFTPAARLRPPVSDAVNPNSPFPAASAEK